MSLSAAFIRGRLLFCFTLGQVQRQFEGAH